MNSENLWGDLPTGDDVEARNATEFETSLAKILMSDAVRHTLAAQSRAVRSTKPEEAAG